MASGQFDEQALHARQFVAQRAALPASRALSRNIIQHRLPQLHRYTLARLFYSTSLAKSARRERSPRCKVT